MSDVATYVYAVIESSRAPALTKAPAGLAESSVPRAIKVADGIWALVTDVPLARYGEAQINAGLKDLDWVSDRALEHEAVVEFATGKWTALPMKLFTIFLDDARATAFFAKELKRLERSFDRIREHQELGVRVSFDESVAATETRARSQSDRPASGAAFLQRKKQLHDVRQELAQQAQDTIDDVHAGLAALAADARRKATVASDLGGPRLLLDGAYLVPTRQVPKFKTHVKTLQKKLPGAYRVTLTGPWPPYHFVEPAP